MNDIISTNGAQLETKNLKLWRVLHICYICMQMLLVVWLIIWTATEGNFFGFFNYPDNSTSYMTWFVAIAILFVYITIAAILRSSDVTRKRSALENTIIIFCALMALSALALNAGSYGSSWPAWIALWALIPLTMLISIIYCIRTIIKITQKLRSLSKETLG